MPLEYYELKRVVIPDSDGPTLATAALITCGLCGTTIDGSGGPGHGPVCTKCATLVFRGEARGAIVWEKD